MGDAFSIGVANATAGDDIVITVLDSNGNAYNTGVNITSAGTYSVPLSSFSGLTAAAASDIDGFLFNVQSAASTAVTGLVLDNLSINTTVPEPTSYGALAGLGLVVVSSRSQFRRQKG